MSQLQNKREIARIASGAGAEVVVAIGVTPKGAAVIEIVRMGAGCGEYPRALWVGAKAARAVAAAITQAASALDATREWVPKPAHAPPSPVAPPWSHNEGARARIARFHAMGGTP